MSITASRARCSGASSKDESERIERVLETIRLTDARNRLAGSLSHGQKQWLEIGMLLAQDPKLLLVDEPVAGMTDVETHQTAELLKEMLIILFIQKRPRGLFVLKGTVVEG